MIENMTSFFIPTVLNNFMEFSLEDDRAMLFKPFSNFAKLIIKFQSIAITARKYIYISINILRKTILNRIT